ncbi:hypothetical protein BRADI_5g18200v3 [Brachypodium distachyon]|uniref:Thioredoxin domain-containing protein n=1 Tax=Brachypodium distachyon TaxID=15368 RepID=A0A0Q3KUY8_BRADI|nr:hypothetical protein BRADI_5g18200v3 [Brachypodium distachyon]
MDLTRRRRDGVPSVVDPSFRGLFEACYRSKQGGMGTETGNGKEEAMKNGLDVTGMPLPSSSHSSVHSAGSDPQLKQMLDCLKSTKCPAVINYGASWCGVCSQILRPFCRRGCCLS